MPFLIKHWCSDPSMIISKELIMSYLTHYHATHESFVNPTVMSISFFELLIKSKATLQQRYEISPKIRDEWEMLERNYQSPLTSLRYAFDVSYTNRKPVTLVVVLIKAI